MKLKIHIRKTELELWFRNGDLKGVLPPGAWFMPGRWIGRDQVEVVSTLNTEVQHPMLDALLLEDAFLAHVIVYDVKDDERAIYWRDGRVAEVLGPGRHVFWKQPRKVEVEVVSTESVRFEHAQLDAILTAPGAAEHLDTLRVQESQKAVLFVDSKIDCLLDAGRHAFWRFGSTGKAYGKMIDLREVTTEVGGQEIMTSDRVTLRVNLLVTWQVVDPLRVVTQVADHGQSIYREAQLVLRAAVGGRTLEQLLADKTTLGRELRDGLEGRLAALGVEVRSFGVRDVILPGDMKSILNQGIEAEKQAEANIIRRREETAAARSQANTARLLADNPVLIRMKELESLQEILKGAKVSFVLGAGDITDQVRSLVAGSDT